MNVIGPTQIVNKRTAYSLRWRGMHTTTGRTMQSHDLTRDQARALKNKLHPMLGYLGRLKRRMVRRGFLNDDPLLAAVVRAEEAMHALHVETHYLV